MSPLVASGVAATIPRTGGTPTARWFLQLGWR